MRFLRLILLPLFLMVLFTDCLSGYIELTDYQILTLNVPVNPTFSPWYVAFTKKDIYYAAAVLNKTGASSNELSSFFQPNIPPQASDDAVTTSEEISAMVNVTANDTDSDGNVDVTTVDLDPATPNIQNSLVVSEGSFSVDPTGLVTFVPNTNYNGVVTITYTVNDDSGDASNSATIQITVDPVNDPPTITGQATPVLNATEDTSFQIQPSDLIISDPDVGDVFSVTILPGTNYTFNGNVVTPSQDYNGPLTVIITVSDQMASSPTFNVNVVVGAVNDSPLIEGQQAISTAEDTEITIHLSDLTVADVDNNYPQDFTLTVSGGSNYNITGLNKITPATNFNGTLTVPVKVNDSHVDSDPFNLSINVTPVNDPPVIGGQAHAISKLEDTPFTIDPSDLILSDPDIGDIISVKLQPGTGYNVISGKVVTNTNAFGPLTVNVVANDGFIDSAPFAVSVTVAPVNDPPAITGQTPLTLQATQNTSFQIALSNLTINDPDNTSFTFNVQSGTNYTFSANPPNGYTITPSAGYYGPLNVNLVVNDGTVDSAPYLFQVMVLAPPVITGQVPLNIDEDSPIPITIALSNLTITDPDTSPANLSLTLLTGPHYSLVGTKVTPDPNYDGLLTVPVYVNDGTFNSNTFNLKITVNPINDPPLITGQNITSVAENQSFNLQVTNFTISDPDNVYPDDFTLSILSGSNYSVTGNTVKPATNFVGTLSVKVQVSDTKGANSPTYTMQIQVSANTPPTITSQTPSSPRNSPEDTAVQIKFSDLTVTDPDNTFPIGFTLNISTGANYTVTAANEITPSPDFNGILTVPLTVNDGTSNSAVFNYKILVTPVNDPPKINGQATLSVNEDSFITLIPSNFTIADVDNFSPSDFTLIILPPGSNYTVSGNKVTPVANYNGTLSVAVKINDGQADSPIFNAQIQVIPVNDPPVITGQKTLVTNEDTPLTIQFSDIIVTDIDNTYSAGFTMNLVTVTNAKYSVAGNTIIPAQNFNGTLSVPVTVNDGSANSNTLNLSITVTPVNDAPTSKGLPVVAVTEDDTNATVVSLLNGFTDVEDAPSLFSYAIITDDHPEYFQSSPTIDPIKGELTFKLKPNAFGTAKITIKVTDTGGLSVQDVLTVNITPVDDPPSFDPIPDITISENASTQIITVKNISAGPLESQVLTLLALSGNTALIPQPTVSYTSPATTGTISFHPNSSQTGSATITVTLIDGGGLQFTQTFQIQVNSVNDPPTLNALSSLTIQEDSPLQNIQLAGITAGPSESQVLTVTAKSDDASKDMFDILDVTYTNPQTTGTLRIKTKPDANGTAQITVTVTDDGSNVLPSVNTFSRVFTLTVQPVNDLPVFISPPVETAVIGDPYQYNIEISDVDNPLSTLTINAVSIPSWTTFTFLGNGQATLVGTPPAGSFGKSTVVLQGKDPSGIPVAQQFDLVVDSRPVVQSFSLATAEDVPISFSSQKFAASFTDADGSPLGVIQIIALPHHGTLKLANVTVKVGDEILAPLLSTLVYQSNQDYYGKDTLNWNGSDGTLYALSASYIAFTITPVNDKPVISGLESDSLKYDVGIGPQFITQTFEAVDVDNDSLASAEIGFRQENFDATVDLLLFTPSTNIKGKYNEQAGVLTLSGKAPKTEYTLVVRSIQYNLATTVNVKLNPKDFYITLNDGLLLSDTRDRVIDLRYKFVDLTIPNAFTPGNEDPNNTWQISHQDLQQFSAAEIHIYNKRGTLVFESIGFEKQWDGSYKGELLPADSYFYTIDLKLEYIKKTYRGVVTILHD